MRLLLLSDLHLEFLSKPQKLYAAISPNMADAVVLAGDIACGTGAEDVIRYLVGVGYRVIYVLGNHEFYGHDPEQLIAQWREISERTPGLYFLHNDAVTLDGITFWGTVLWSHLNTQRQTEAVDRLLRQNLKRVADFRHIKVWSPKMMQQHYYQALDYLTRFLHQPTTGRIVVISHFLPSYRCIDTAFAASPLNPYFASPLDKLIEQTQPALWLHGHTHSSVRLSIGQTRIMANPRGYPHLAHELNPQISWDQVIWL
ncbi:metallophosphoesterase [Bowmanella sp. JS7-9]|uniref:Metallophosphoesterase n=1 Tax=Pseudobowmanella zhangzhouensis TaxID=1537679 RepID=A0ABW1XM85_9ALTE|nr:metallophosphoesterase [Bowmanella sp. JS7-9]